MRKQISNKILAITLRVLVVLIIFSCCGSCFPTANAAGLEKSYIYDETKVARYVPDAYDYYLSVDLTVDGIAAEKPSDMYVTDSMIYVTDQGNHRVLIFDSNFNAVKAIDTIVDANGAESKLKQPNGIYAYSDGRILIADTGNKRIVLIDDNGNLLLEIRKPKNMVGVSTENDFLPTKVAADKIGRIYAVVENVNNGILQFDSKGAFMGYLGAPAVKTDFWTKLWKSIFSKEQQDQMESFVPTEYNNLYIDSEDFLWGTIGTEPESPIRKLNSMGNDILVRNGLFAPQGDFTTDTNAKSVIIDVATNTNGTYSMLDQTRGRIFTYDAKGNLLFIFGNKGEREENFGQPIAISYFNNMLFILDNAHNKLSVFRTTKYGQLLYDAVNAQYTGDFDSANALWSQIASENSNLKYAFSGLGNSELSIGNYEQALTYFEYAGDVDGYSNAKEMLRKQQMKSVFPYMFTGIAVVLVALITGSLVKKFLRYYKGENLQ